MKYRLLVVEDDNNIRNGLVKIIGRMQLPVENIFSAGSGSEALEVAEKVNPHIIITDIKMPSMSGLDFIERIKEKGSTAKIIILSGYSEFSFAQKAISFNVSEYLLKPIKKDKLYDILVKIMEEIRLEQQELEQKEDSDRKIREYHLMLLKEILAGYQNASDIDYIFSNAGLVYRKTGFIVYAVYCKTRTGQITDLLEQSARELSIIFQYTTRYDHIICLVNINSDEYADACQLLKRKISNFAAENKVDAYAGISEWKKTTSGLSDLVREAEKALDFRLFKCTQQVFHYAKVKKYTRQKPALNVYYEEIRNASNQCDMQSMNSGIDRMFDFLCGLSPLTPSLFKNSVAGYILYYMPPDKQDLIIEKINDIEDTYQLSDSLIDFKINIKQMLYQLCKNEKAGHDKQYGGKINAAIRYIEENYNQNIYLETVANHIHANASYFSNSFKRATGMYFSDYLQKIRIEKAKTLLMQPQHKIYEIAESTGFLDEKYFFKVFKKITGVTPTQYRNGMYLDKNDIGIEDEEDDEDGEN